MRPLKYFRRVKLHFQILKELYPHVDDQVLESAIVYQPLTKEYLVKFISTLDTLELKN